MFVSSFILRQGVTSLVLFNCNNKCLSEDAMSNEYEMADEIKQQTNSSYKIKTVFENTSINSTTDIYRIVSIDV